MGTAIKIGSGLSAAALRQSARQETDGRAAARMYAIAHALDGLNRAAGRHPIEMAFSELKGHLRRIGARDFTDFFEGLGEVCALFTPEECWNYFRQPGYDSA